MVNQRRKRTLPIRPNRSSKKAVPIPTLFAKNGTPEQLNAKMLAFHAFSDVERFARIVTLEEAGKNDFNLSPSQCVETGAAKEYKEIPTLLTELGKLEEEGRRLTRTLPMCFRSLD